MDDAIIYLHGTPGSPAELALFGEPDLGWYAPDRYELSAGKGVKEALDDLARDLSERVSSRQLHLIGFSMGGYIALQLAHRLGEAVSQIDLISSVAPFQGGDFLKDAAGAPLFKLAQGKPRLFKVAVAAQHLAARVAPARLAAMLFASARGDDIDLVQNANFMAKNAAMLRNSFAHGSNGYAREMIGVTQDWRHILPTIKAPVKIWHGTLDNWAPFGMAQYLRTALPNIIEFNAIKGASHYSTLQRAQLDCYSG